MQHSHAIRQTSKIRCQLLTCSTLAAALLFETRGLMDDLSMAGARATVRVQMSTMTLGGRIQPGLHDRRPMPPEIEPIATKPDPGPVMSDDRGLDSTAQTDG